MSICNRCGKENYGSTFHECTPTDPTDVKARAIEVIRGNGMHMDNPIAIADRLDAEGLLASTELLAAQAEVTRLRGLFEQILAHPEDMAYDARFWRNFASEALAPKDPS